MKKRNIFWAVILIFIAVYLVASKMHMIPAIPFFKILFTVIFVYTAVYGFVRLHFFEGMLSVGLLGCMYDKVLGIQAITPWTLLLAACLVGLALDPLFRNLKKQKDILILDTAMQADMWRMDRMVSMYMWKILLER